MPFDKTDLDELATLREEHDWLESNLEASADLEHPHSREVRRTGAELLAQIRRRIEELTTLSQG